MATTGGIGDSPPQPPLEPGTWVMVGHLDRATHDKYYGDEWANPGKQDGQDGMNRPPGLDVEVHAGMNGVLRS